MNSESPSRKPGPRRQKRATRAVANLLNAVDKAIAAAAEAKQARDELVRLTGAEVKRAG